MFLRPTSLFTRLCAVVIGLIWTVAGGWWAYHVFILETFDFTARFHSISLAILGCGVMLIVSALRRSKPTDFESETPDLHRNFGNDWWWGGA